MDTRLYRCVAAFKNPCYFEIDQQKSRGVLLYILGLGVPGQLTVIFHRRIGMAHKGKRRVGANAGFVRWGSAMGASVVWTAVVAVTTERTTGT